MERFQTATHDFIRLYFDEVEDLKEGDNVVILTELDIPKKAIFEDAIVIRPLFKDDREWKVETSLGIVSIEKIYKVEKI